MAATPLPAILVKFIGDTIIVNYSGVASACCLLYDTIISLDREVDYIWKSKWSIPKVLYLFSRYFSLFVQLTTLVVSVNYHLSNSFCQRWTQFVGVSGQLIILGVEIILMIRVYALYRRNNKILALIAVLYLAEVVTVSTILGKGLTQIVTVSPSQSGFIPKGIKLPGCLPIRVPRFFSYYWVAPLVFESVLFILMVVHFTKHYQPVRLPLLTKFLRDGTAFYAIVFSFLLLQVLLYSLVHSELAQIVIGWEITITSIAGTRLILNLRSAAAQPMSSTDSNSIELIEFDEPSRPYQPRNPDAVYSSQRGGTGSSGGGNYTTYYPTSPRSRWYTTHLLSTIPHSPVTASGSLWSPEVESPSGRGGGIGVGHIARGGLGHRAGTGSSFTFSDSPTATHSSDRDRVHGHHDPGFGHGHGHEASEGSLITMSPPAPSASTSSTLYDPGTYSPRRYAHYGYGHHGHGDPEGSGSSFGYEGESVDERERTLSLTSTSHLQLLDDRGISGRGRGRRGTREFNDRPTSWLEEFER